MDEDGEAAAEEEVVAEQHDEVVVTAADRENGKRLVTRQPSEPGHGR